MPAYGQSAFELGRRPLRAQRRRSVLKAIYLFSPLASPRGLNERSRQRLTGAFRDPWAQNGEPNVVEKSKHPQSPPMPSRWLLLKLYKGQMAILVILTAAGNALNLAGISVTGY